MTQEETEKRGAKGAGEGRREAAAADESRGAGGRDEVSAAGMGSTGVEPAPLDEHAVLALHAASDKKARDLVALDLRELASFTDHFLIATGGNIRQVQAIADEVVERLKKSGRRALRVEGYKTAEWVLVDYGDFILHVFEEKARRFYDLERLWRDAARVPLPPELSDGAAAGPAADPTGR